MKMDKKIAFAVLFAIMFLATPVVSVTKSTVTLRDPEEWYMYVPGVLDTDTYVLYPYTDTRLDIGFSKFGEFINPYAYSTSFPGNDAVGLEYVDPVDPRDPFAREGIPMNQWLNGWLINVTYVSSILTPSLRNVWAFAMYSDTTEPGVGGPWACGLAHFTAGEGGRQTSGYAETDPIRVVQNGPRRFVAVLTTHLYDVMGSFRFQLVDVVFTIVFDKVEKNVLIYKDIHYRLGPKEGMINVQFSNRGQWDLGPSPTFYSEAKYFHQELPTCYGADYLLTPWILRDTYDIIDIGDGDSLYELAHATYGTDFPQIQGTGNIHEEGSLRIYTLGCPTVEYPDVPADDGHHHYPAVLGTAIVTVNGALQRAGVDYTDVWTGDNNGELEPYNYKDMWAIRFIHDIVGPATIRIEYKNIVKQLKIWDDATGWTETAASHHYDVAQFISDDSPTPEFVGFAAFWPTCSDYTVDGWMTKFVDLWGTPPLFSEDVITDPIAKIPFLIGEWDFMLDPATSQFRGVTKYGIVDYHDANNAAGVIDKEAMYQLNEVFNPWDLNDATNKITSRHYEDFTAEDDQEIFELSGAVAMYDFAWVDEGAIAEWSTDYAHSGIESAKMDADEKQLLMRLVIPWKVQLEKLKATLDDETKVYWYVYLTETIDNLQGYDLTMQMNIRMDNNGDGIVDYFFHSVGTDQTGQPTCTQNWPAGQWIQASPRETAGGAGPGIDWMLLGANMYGATMEDVHTMGEWNAITSSSGAFKEDTVIAIELSFYPAADKTFGNWYKGILYIDDVTLRVYEPLADDYRTVLFDLENLNADWPDIRYCKFAEKVLVNGVLQTRGDDYLVDILRVYEPSGQTILSDIVFADGLAEDDLVEVEYSSFDLGRYEWITVGTYSWAVDAAGAAMISEYFDSKKEISVWMSGLDMQDWLNGPEVPWIFSDLGGTGYVDPLEYRAHVRHAWCTTVPIESSNIIVVGGPLANLGAYYLNDFTPAFWDYENSQIIALSCWSMNAYRNGYNNPWLLDTGTGEWVSQAVPPIAADVGYAVISTYKDKNQTAWFDVWGITGQDTYYASWAIWNTWLGEKLQQEPNCLTTLIVKFDYTKHPYDKCFITIVESLGTISEHNWGKMYANLGAIDGKPIAVTKYLDWVGIDTTRVSVYKDTDKDGIADLTELVTTGYKAYEDRIVFTLESGEYNVLVVYYLKQPPIHPCRPVP